MYPTIYFGPYSIGAYRLGTILGAVVAILIALPRLRRAGLTWRRSIGMLGGMCLAFLVGARLWNITVNPSFYENNPWYELKLRGLSLYGGLLGALLVLILFTVSKKEKDRPWLALDAMTPPAGIAFCVSRVGCFLNGCCYGKPTSSILGIVFPSHHHVSPFGGTLQIPVWPTQLFELFGALIGLPIVFRLADKYDWPPGGRFLAYSAWFSIMRLIVLPFRKLPYPDLVVRLIYPLVYAGLAVAGIYLLVKRKKQQEKAETDLSKID